MAVRKTETLSVKIDPETKEMARELAELDKRSLSSYIGCLIEQEYQRKALRSAQRGA